LEKKEEIVTKLSEVYNESKEVESGIAQDIVDKAESSYTKEFLLSLSNAERAQLFLIDDALKRLEKNEYGICQMCQKIIIKKGWMLFPGLLTASSVSKKQKKSLDNFFRNKVSSIAKLAELIFFPSFCELCSSLLESSEERVICRSCWERMIPFSLSYCLCCGRFFEGSAEPHLCQECLEERPPFTYHRSYGRYRGKLKDAILLYKYRRFSSSGW